MSVAEYLSRLRFRLGVTSLQNAEVDAHFKSAGNPFIDTPAGRIVRPSLAQLG